MSGWNILSCEWLNPPPLTDGGTIRVEADLWRDRAKLEREIRTVDALIVRNQTRIDDELLSRAERLKVVGRLGSGLDNVDVAAVRRRGATVTYAPDSNTRSVAEFCLAQIFALLRQLPAAGLSTAAGGWERTAFPAREISSCTVGIVGFGRTGRTLGEMLTGLGAGVLVHARQQGPLAGGWHSLPFDTVLAGSDIISLHVPGGAGTERMLGEREFGLMKRGALLVNSSRGAVVDEGALIAALRAGRIAGAALDVRVQEPPVPGVLESFPNVLLTPHVAAFTVEAQQRVAQRVIDDVMAVLKGGEPRCPAP